eukprot:237396-Chlamydomonas_euryale.AAC.9
MHTYKFTLHTCVSCAYASISAALSLAEPTSSRPRPMPAASPATAESVYITFLISSATSSSSVPSAARPGRGDAGSGVRGGQPSCGAASVNQGKAWPWQQDRGNAGSCMRVRSAQVWGSGCPSRARTEAWAGFPSNHQPLRA